MTDVLSNATRQSFDGIVRRLSCESSQTGLLANKSFGAKDLFDVAGYVTGAGNPTWLETHNEATHTARAILRLTDAGAKLIGKTCTDELAFSLDGINVHYGTPLNPQAPDCIPGGSSSGSASIVASGLSDFAIGTDTAGSIRVPASYCGIYGFRPTHGRIATDGVVPLGPDFDTVGWFARNAEMLQNCGQVLLAESPTIALPSTMKFWTDGFAMVDEDFSPRLDELVDGIKRGFAVIPHVELGQQVIESWLKWFGIVRGWQAWQCHGQWIEQARPRFAPDIEQRFMHCKTITERDFQQAEAERRKILDPILSLLPADAVLCLPTTCGPPPLKTSDEATLSANRKKNLALCAIASVAGLPQVTIPVSVSPALTTGLSFIGSPGSDMMLLNLACHLTDIGIAKRLAA